MSIHNNGHFYPMSFTPLVQPEPSSPSSIARLANSYRVASSATSQKLESRMISDLGMSQITHASRDQQFASVKKLALALISAIEGTKLTRVDSKKNSVHETYECPLRINSRDGCLQATFSLNEKNELTPETVSFHEAYRLPLEWKVQKQQDLQPKNLIKPPEQRPRISSAVQLSLQQYLTEHPEGTTVDFPSRKSPPSAYKNRQFVPASLALPARLRIDTKKDVDLPLRGPSTQALNQYRSNDVLSPPTFVSTFAGVAAKYGSVHVPLSLRADYEGARRYLAYGPEGRKLLASAETYDVPIYLKQTELNAEQTTSVSEKGLEILVLWDPRMAIASTAGGRSCPADVLAHELGHSIRRYRDARGGYFENGPNFDSIPSSTNANERNVIRSSEAAIAREHHQPDIRDDHSGAIYKTRTVTSREALFPDDQAAIVSYSARFRGLTAEMDKRDINPELTPLPLVIKSGQQALRQGLGPVATLSDVDLIAARRLLMNNMRADLQKLSDLRQESSSRETGLT